MTGTRRNSIAIHFTALTDKTAAKLHRTLISQTSYLYTILCYESFLISIATIFFTFYAQPRVKSCRLGKALYATRRPSSTTSTLYYGFIFLKANGAAAAWKRLDAILSQLCPNYIKGPSNPLCPAMVYSDYSTLFLPSPTQSYP